MPPFTDLVSARESEIASSLPAVLPDAERATELQRQMVQWRAHHAAEFNAEREQLAAQLKSRSSVTPARTAVQRIMLGDLDSYHWLRMARNYLQTGTTCVTLVMDGQCRDTYANAPVGRRNIYHRSLHIAAIVAVHRVITWFKPAYPLEESQLIS